MEFNPDLAKEYNSVNIAVFIKNFDYWLAKNKANHNNYFDGRYWTYNSAKAYSQLFNWLSESQASRILNKMEKSGILLSGCHSQNKHDRTKWFTFTDEFLKLYGSILRFHKVKPTNLPNLPITITDIKPDSNVLFKEFDKTIETKFIDSAAYPIEIFKSQFNGEAEIIDLDYYHGAVNRWCEGLSNKDKRKHKTARGWIATAQQFMASDTDNKKLKKINTESSAEEYLNK